MFNKLSLLAVLALAAVGQAKYDTPDNLPAKTDSKGGQIGYNDCRKRYGESSQKSMCQNAYINSIKDFCLWGPPKAGSTVGDTEAIEVAWCLKSGYGTRLIPNGAIKGAHFLKTPSYVQVTGTGDLTKINVKKGDDGGELDPHGATGSGNPVGGLVYTRAYTGQFQRVYEWQNFISDREFCFRACNPKGANQKEWCPHIYDVMGCYWNEPANYNAGSWDQCDGTEGEWPGVYHGSTFYQGQKHTPGPQTPGKSSNCRAYPSLTSGGDAIKKPGSKRQVMETARPVA
ncbi:hypothetical protein BDZ90DRAFT_129162 [Jaminaea rosea]|uniref:Carbohydrate-binding module family 13 protein n=1 Tax=Jaminaea rosea TaxID=1569628 RepID=A0A316UTV5_9BASI|nr:hypothetical protein BDZ90DRAFT_129162 [Jaminaea rosea]PWN28730.1 hypothetical protein BDZ90DRAFT_129162 [Jaminaea rosea]